MGQKTSGNGVREFGVLPWKRIQYGQRNGIARDRAKQAVDDFFDRHWDDDDESAL